MSEKKKFKDTKFAGFLDKAKDAILDNGGDVIDIAITAATQGPAAAVAKTIQTLKKGSSPESIQMSQELQARAQEFEKEMYELEIRDRESARGREVDVARTGKTDWMMIATGATGLASFLAIVISVIFKADLQENSLFIHLMGMIEGVVIGNIFAYYYGTSKSSKDKTSQLEKLLK